MIAVFYFIVLNFFMFLSLMIAWDINIINIFGVMIVYGVPSFLLSYHLGKRGISKEIKIYLGLLFFIRLIFDCIVLILDSNYLVIDLTAAFLQVPIIGSFMFSHIFLVLGIMLGLKKNGNNTNFFKARYITYVLIVIFSCLNLYLNNYCSITGYYCNTNVIVLLNTLVTIPIIEMIYNIFRQESFKKTKIIILLLLIGIGYSVEIFELQKTAYDMKCNCATATNCTLKEENVYECNFIGEDGETLCQIECNGYK